MFLLSEADEALKTDGSYEYTLFFTHTTFINRRMAYHFLCSWKQYVGIKEHARDDNTMVILIMFQKRCLPY